MRARRPGAHPLSPPAQTEVPTDDARAGDPPAWAVAALFLVSGFAAIVYQVLWVRELGLLIGATAQAAALTIAVFFTGLAWGGWFWGRRAGAMARPLRSFGWLEVGVAVTALGYFVLIDLYVALYPSLFGLIGDRPALDTLVKAAIATAVLLPPSFLMGGTLPVLGQHLVRARERLGSVGSGLYAINTLGSAAGAIAAGFVLPLVLGFRGAYLLAIGLDLAVGVTAIVLARGARRVAVGPTVPVGSTTDVGGSDGSGGSGGSGVPGGPTGSGRAGGRPAASARSTGPPRTTGPAPIPPALIWTIAFVSGVTTLAVEVLWTRMFAQVLQNSAYTYALVLAAFLSALALGAGLANRLNRLRNPSPRVVLLVLLGLSGVATAISPWLFHARTDGLALLGANLDFGAYVAAVLALVVVVMLLPGLVLGAVLPYLLRMLQDRRRAPGDTIGRLIAVNTVGGIIGSLLAGFVLLPLVGTWRSILVVAAVYPLLVAALALTGAGDRAGDRAGRGARGARAARSRAVGLAAAAAAVGVALVPTDGLEVVRLTPDGRQSLVEVTEGTQATVSVVAERDDLFLRLNNHYTLGGTRSHDAERDQSAIPLLLHPDPSRVFYLGMGTGITAGAGLAFEPDHVEVCELIDDVVRLAEAHFGPWVAGLFDHDRVSITAEDGRICLARSDTTYDMIISDLFTPWEAGTGNLYTREHYTVTRDALEPGGMMVQWVPLFQASDVELGIIARTMDEVFDQVTMWRGDFFADRSVVALVGHRDPTPFDPGVAAAQGRALHRALTDGASSAAASQEGEGGDGGDGGDGPLGDDFFEALLLRHYVGNVTASGVYADRGINTDTMPLIEYTAPRTQRAVRAGEGTFLTGVARERLYDRFLEALDPTDDPYLAGLDEAQLDYVRAGRRYSAFRFHDRRGDDERAEVALDDFFRWSPPTARGVDDLSPARRLLPRIDAPRRQG